MHKFLLAVDGSESSLWAASHVAERIHGGDAIDLHLLNAQPIRPIHPALRKIVSQAMMEEYARSHAEEAFHEVKALLHDQRIAFSTHVAFDQPAFGIADHVQALDIAQLIMGTRGSRAFVRFALGSVASRVVNMVDIPITLVPKPYRLLREAGPSGVTLPAVDRSATVTLLPVDGSEFSDRAVELAIQESSTGAVRKIVLLNVQSPYPSGPGWVDVPPAELERAYRDASEDSMRSARRKLDDAGCAYQAESLVGPNAELIAQRAREVGCDRIIMGTRGLGEGGSFFLGSVAVKVVHLAGIPVTLVK